MFAVPSAFWNGIMGWKLTDNPNGKVFLVIFRGSDQEVNWPVPEIHAVDMEMLLMKAIPEKRFS